MFLDLRNLESDQALDFDLCVVGTGPAGIALARRLAGPNLRVGMLESGGLAFESDAQALSEGTSTGPQYPPLVAVRQRAFGGTTGHWGGQSCPLEEEDFKIRDWVAGSGWPITFGELSMYLPAASDICGVPYGGYRWDDLYGERDDAAFPLDPEKFSDPLFRFSYPPRKFGDFFRDEFGASHHITCVFHAYVTQIVGNDALDHITHLEVAAPDGRVRQVRAKRFVLACGGIENSRLMLASNRGNPAGIGNDHDLVGRFFMEHPNFDGGTIRISDPAKSEALTAPNSKQGSELVRRDFKLSEPEQQRLGILNHSAFLIPKNTGRTHMSQDVGYMGKVWRKLEKAYDKLFDDDDPETNKEFKLRVRLEQAPNANSRVRLGEAVDAFGIPKPQLDIRLSDAEGKTIEAVQTQVALELGRAGLGRMQVDFDPTDQSWQDKCGWQIHHCGGTRMHTSPGSGVVDPNARVFGIDNLYIAGSSVFPTSGHGNPTLNLVALSLRLADHLRQEPTR